MSPSLAGPTRLYRGSSCTKTQQSNIYVKNETQKLKIKNIYFGWSGFKKPDFSVHKITCFLDDDKAQFLSDPLLILTSNNSKFFIFTTSVT